MGLKKYPTEDALCKGQLNINNTIYKIPELETFLSKSGILFHIFGASKTHATDTVSDNNISIPG